ncbi:zinc finger, CCHC-type containing protein, partial [Tanacetum coccineum]
MAAAAMKHMASNFVKLDKFEGVDFRRWQKKMHFLLSSMSVLYMLNTPILEDGENATVEQIRKRAKWDNDDYVCGGLILNEQYNELLGILGRFTQHKINMDEAIQVSCIIDKLPPTWKHFKHTLKHKKEKLTLVELGSHLRIEESLWVQDNDKPKGNNVAGPLVVNMVEHNNSSRYTNNRSKRKHHDNTKAHPNKKPKVTCWKCEKPEHLKKDCKDEKVGNKANGPGTNDSVDGSTNSLKGQNMFNKSLRPNGDALRKCILEGPYKLTTVTIPAVPATDDTPALLLIGIGDEIYSTVDACKTAHDMWIVIERLQHGKSLNIQDVKTNLFWDFGRFTSHDGESMESYYFRFYKMMNEMEVNEIRAERIAKNANPLALVATAQHYPDPYYQVPKHHKSYAPPSKQSSSTRSHASTKYKGKEISKPITPQSESTSEEDSDPKQAQRDKDMQKNLALIVKYFKNIYKPTNNNLRTSSNSRNKNVDTSPRYKNENQTEKFGNQRTVTVAGARETVGSQ